MAEIFQVQSTARWRVIYWTNYTWKKLVEFGKQLVQMCNHSVKYREKLRCHGKLWELLHNHQHGLCNIKIHGCVSEDVQYISELFTGTTKSLFSTPRIIKPSNNSMLSLQNECGDSENSFSFESYAFSNDCLLFLFSWERDFWLATVVYCTHGEPSTLHHEQTISFEEMHILIIYIYS